MSSRQVALLARRSFTLSGHRVVRGEEFTATSKDALILVTVGHATYAPPAPTPQPPVEAEKSKRTYRRRDQSSEDVGSPSPTRRYRRRDLQAED